MICKRDAIHKNCNIIESYFVFFANNISKPATKNKMSDEYIQLNQKTPEYIINPDNKYITISEIFHDFELIFLLQIYNKIFQNIALPTYHQIKIILLHHQAVSATQLQSRFIFIEFTQPPVTKAKKLCPNSCIKVTRRFIG